MVYVNEMLLCVFCWVELHRGDSISQLAPSGVCSLELNRRSMVWCDITCDRDGILKTF